jgi:hypothetical protein
MTASWPRHLPFNRGSSLPSDEALAFADLPEPHHLPNIDEFTGREGGCSFSR